jgi:nucleoid DNA-binding protein
MEKGKATKAYLKKKVFEKLTEDSGKPHLSQLTERDVSIIVDMVIESAKESIEERRGLVIKNFGSFSRVIKKKTRKKIPSTNEIRVIPQRIGLSFEPAPNFIEKLK